ncbi:MAG: sigma-70 family RNA polymerase sigma factor [Opitutae bacterium]|jgi:RNA polymerase sigma factor (sigma-70 family)|nr:sigma-70 family RNA polymerase sigma factor [Opitutae bacterium]
MGNEIDIAKLGEWNQSEWNKVLPILNASAYAYLNRRFSFSESDAKEVLGDSLIQVVNSFSFEDGKTFDDLKRFAMAVACKRGIDLLRKEIAQKRGGGRVLSLDEEIGEGLTRLDQIANKLGSIDPQELADISIALEDCQKESLNEKEKGFFHSFYVLGENQREISEKHTIPIGSVGTTLKRALMKIHKCLLGKGYENPFSRD